MAQLQYNFIDDLLDNTGNFKSGAEIFQQLEGTNRANWLIEYNTTLKSIPRAWKDKIKGTNMDIKVKKDLKPFINDGNKYIYDLPLNSKGYYEKLIKKINAKSYIEKYWDNVIPNKPTWTEVWRTRVKEQKNKKTG